MVAANLAAVVLVAVIFYGIVQMLERSPPAVSPYFARIVEVWIAVLLVAGFGVFANNIVVRQPSIDGFGGLFDPLLEVERTAFTQNKPAEYRAHVLQRNRLRSYALRRPIIGTLRILVSSPLTMRDSDLVHNPIPVFPEGKASHPRIHQGNHHGLRHFQYCGKDAERHALDLPCRAGRIEPSTDGLLLAQGC